MFFTSFSFLTSLAAHVECEPRKRICACSLKDIIMKDAVWNATVCKFCLVYNGILYNTQADSIRLAKTFNIGDLYLVHVCTWNHPFFYNSRSNAFASIDVLSPYHYDLTFGDHEMVVDTIRFSSNNSYFQNWAIWPLEHIIDKKRISIKRKRTILLFAVRSNQLGSFIA